MFHNDQAQVTEQPQVKEPNLQMLARGRTVYEPPRYMSVNTAIEQLMEVEAKHGGGICGPMALGVGIARLGAEDQQIVAGALFVFVLCLLFASFALVLYLVTMARCSADCTEIYLSFSVRL